MKPVIIIAIAFVLLIPSIIYADHATTYNEHWDSLCQYDYDRKMKSVAEKFKDDKFMNFHNDLLQKCLDEFSPLETEVIPDDDIIHPTCDLSCLPKNYEFGTNRIQDKDVLLCFDKWWKGRTLVSMQCPESPQFEEFNSKYTELKQVWEEVYQTSNKPEFYPMEPYFRQFTDADAFCLLESEDYTDCLLESHGALENMKASNSWMYSLLYHGCHSAARDLMVSGEMTRAEASYVFNQCEFFADYIIQDSTGTSQNKIICSAPDGYCMEKHGMNNPDAYGECLGKWVPFCQTYEAKQPELEPEISQEKYFVTPLPIVCGKGTILIDHICQVDKIEEKEKEIPIEKTIEKTVDIPVEKPSNKSGGWFDWLFNWWK